MFHVSKRDLGERVTLTPRIPINAAKSEDRVTPRVCFSPTVEQCVIGIVGYGINQDITFLGAFSILANSQWCPTVYKTEETLFEPDWVSDFHITHEEWALDPIEVKRVGYIDCMMMVREKRICIVDHPVYVNNADSELIYHLNEDDRNLLLKAVSN